jgi:hypothetical protein
VNQEDPIERSGRKHGVSRRSQLDRDIIEPFSLHPIGQLLGDIGDDIFGEHSSLRSNDARQPNRIIALPSPNIRDPHSRLNAGELHHLLGFAQPVPSVLG